MPVTSHLVTACPRTYPMQGGERGTERLLSAVPENEFFQSEMRAEPDAFSGLPDEQTMG